MSLGGLGSIKRMEDDGRREGDRDEKRNSGKPKGEEAVSNHGLPWMDWSC